jgi:tetratricopeptide (TPR) repeat protein
VARNSNGVLDAAGNPTSGTADGIVRYDRAVDLLLRYDPDVVGAAEQLATLDAAMPMAQTFSAYLALMSTDAPDVESARAAVAALDSLALNAREAAHAAAIAAWLEGRWRGAARVLDELLIRWPTDMLALVMGHVLDFFTGDARNLRDRVGRSLPSFDPDDPRAAFAKGLQAFGLEESGDYARAEAVGLEALERHPDDVWALHAVVHTYEMRGMVDTGISVMRAREPDWGGANLFRVHNWWHLALYLLEAGQYDDALTIYDAEVHNERSGGVSLEMLDASALLWRITLDGMETGDRYSALASAWEGQVFDEPWYVFNDLHAVIAYCGAGRTEDARAIIDRLERYVASTDDEPGTNHAMTAEIGVPASRAIVAFTEGDDDDVLAELLPIRRRFHHFGGSHAQRDILQRTLTEAAIRSDQLDLARALLDERLSLRDTSVYGSLARARVLARRGDDFGAIAEREKATANRARFAAAAAG